MLVDFEDGRPRPARPPELLATPRQLPERRSRTGGPAELHLRALRSTVPRQPAWVPPPLPPVSTSQSESLAPVILACLATLLIAVAILAASVMSASA